MRQIRNTGHGKSSCSRSYANPQPSSRSSRLERKDIHLDKETPYISLYDTELKTKERKRIVLYPSELNDSRAP